MSRIPSRTLHRLTAAATIAMITAACADDSATAPESRPATLRANTWTPVEGSYVIVKKPGAGSALRSRVVEAGASIAADMSDINVMLVRGMTAEDAAALREQSDVAAVVQDLATNWLPTGEQRPRAQVQMTQLGLRAQDTDQSDAFFFADQWNMRRVDADDAWSQVPSRAGTLVCVLDSGVDPGQMDLLGKVDLAKSTSFIASEPFIEDLNFHGTFVASLISSNGLGIASVSPNSTLCAVKVLDLTGNGSFGGVIAGIMYAVDQGADVLNLSLGAYFDRTLPGADALLQALTDAVAYANARGAHVIVAAGNDGANLEEDGTMIAVPAETPGVLTVAATAPINQQNFDMLASYSNFGGRTNRVDLSAPGGDFVSGGVLEDLVLAACSRYVCGGDGWYVFASGTSFAAPHVAGASAVVEGAQLRDLDYYRSDNCILSNLDRVLRPNGAQDKRHGKGRLNVLKAGLACKAS
jgi:subtilisin family serine protease